MSIHIQPSKERIHKACAAWVVWFALLATMFIGTHLPTDVASFGGWWDKVAHFGGYALLAISGLAALDLTLSGIGPQHYFYVWLFLTFYGFVDEVTQVYAGRSCDFTDWVCDAVGALAGIEMYRHFRGAVRALSATDTAS